eukprot:5507616-Prymnesium_polylepis.1
MASRTQQVALGRPRTAAAKRCLLVRSTRRNLRCKSDMSDAGATHDATDATLTTTGCTYRCRERPVTKLLLRILFLSDANDVLTKPIFHYLERPITASSRMISCPGSARWPISCAGAC